MKERFDCRKLGFAIKTFRSAAGLKQAEIAEQIGVTQNYVSMVERGQREPSLSFLWSFCKQLDVPLNLLFLTATAESEDSSSPRTQAATSIRALLVEAQTLALEARREKSK